MSSSGRRNFDPEYIRKEFAGIDNILSKKLRVYVLGGAVMAIEGLKDGTRDIDVLMEDKMNHEILVQALEKCH